MVFKWILIAYAVPFSGYQVVMASTTYGDLVKHPVLYGMFNTQTFVFYKDTLKPLTTDTIRWRRLIISAYGSANIRLMNDSARGYSFKDDSKAKTITLGSYKDTTCKYVFKYTLSKDSVLHMSGIGPTGPVSVTLKRFNEQNYLLLKRGFHFVNEYPFGR